MTDKKQILEMRGINKRFPGVQALNSVSLNLYAGEVLALLGENGAGKSTLIKILGGAYRADSGEIRIQGESEPPQSPADAVEKGVSIIYQEFNLIPELTVSENIFLGKERTRRGFINRREERAAARELFSRIGFDLDPDAPCKTLTVAQQQSVEIVKALSVDAKIIVMDEPTATLTSEEVQKLFDVIKELKTQNIGIIYITHRLEEIFKVADRIAVLRDGIRVGEAETGDISRKALIEMMVGRPMEAEFPEHTPKTGTERLRVQNLNRGNRVKDVSFTLHSGEILGFAGLVGSGRTDTIRLIFGADTPDSGSIFVNGKACKIRNPMDAIRNRLCLLTEDRKNQGLVLVHSSRENFGLPNLKHFQKGLFLNSQQERQTFKKYIKDLRIKLSDPEMPISSLSGGNQQKIVLAKWLESQADIIIFDEPTRGIDVGAKYEIYLLIHALADQGKAVIIVSSELPELIGLCDRILIMHEGQMKGEVNTPSEVTQEDILSMAIS